MVLKWKPEDEPKNSQVPASSPSNSVSKQNELANARAPQLYRPELNPESKLGATFSLQHVLEVADLAISGTRLVHSALREHGLNTAARAFCAATDTRIVLDGLHRHTGKSGQVGAQLAKLDPLLSQAGQNVLAALDRVRSESTDAVTRENCVSAMRTVLDGYARMERVTPLDKSVTQLLAAYQRKLG